MQAFDKVISRDKIGVISYEFTFQVKRKER